MRFGFVGCVGCGAKLPAWLMWLHRCGDAVARMEIVRAAAVRGELREAAQMDVQPRKKSVYVGAPAIFALDLCCQHVNAAFGEFGCYLVGSALERQDWRDIDVRFIMTDQKFAELFPDSHEGCWEQDRRWLLLTVSISAWMANVTGLPIDFQIQPQTHANEAHDKQRNALGMIIKRRKAA